MRNVVSPIMILIILFSSLVVFAPKGFAGAPVISTVSMIKATRLQTIYIYGSGFGNTWPQTTPVGDGSVDTVEGSARASSTTPWMTIGDTGKYQKTGDTSDGGENWAAGTTDFSTVFCMVGIYITSWTDTEIILGGFGTHLGTNGQGTWYIESGDPLSVDVFTPSGHAVYHTTAASPGTTPITVVCSPNPVFACSPVECTATVSGVNPTGTVTWSSSSNTGQFQMTSGLLNGHAYATYVDTSIGAVTIKASYSGDSNNAASTGQVALKLNPCKGIENIVTGVRSIIPESPFCFSIQQNFWVKCGTDGPMYWCQNCIQVGLPLPTWELCREMIWPSATPPPLLPLWQDEDRSQFIDDTMDFKSLCSGKAITFKDPLGVAHIFDFSTLSAFSGDVYILTDHSCLVIVGPEFSLNVHFDAGNGYVSCKTMNLDTTWSPAQIYEIVPNKAETGETSDGLAWDLTGHYWAAVSKDEGLYFRPSPSASATGSSILENGATMQDHAVFTGLSVSITGSSALDGTAVTIATASLSGSPAGLPEASITHAAYYDVNVQSISDGTASVYVTNSGVLGQTTMQYWNGAQWVKATAVVVSGNTVCGNIPISALTGTIIVIGPLMGPSSVGGEWVPITMQTLTPANTYQMLAQWITLASLAMVALTSFVYVNHKKKQQN